MVKPRYHRRRCLHERPALLCATSARVLCLVSEGRASALRSGRSSQHTGDLSIYVFSGAEDPVGQRLEGVQVLIHRYHNAGIRDISHDFYRGGRHEMLNEINREEVRSRLLGWIFDVLKRG